MAACFMAHITKNTDRVTSNKPFGLYTAACSLPSSRKQSIRLGVDPCDGSLVRTYLRSLVFTVELEGEDGQPVVLC